MERRVTGIVLAGGRSTRFGADKLAAPLAGAPLLHHAIGAVAAVADEVIVVTAPGDPDPAMPTRSAQVRIVHDARRHEGPLAGFHAGATAATGSLLVLAAGDQPTLEPAVLRQLLAEVRGGARAAVLGSPQPDGPAFQPMPSALDRDAALASAANALAHGHRSLVALLSRLRVTVLPPDAWLPLDPAGATLRDIDRPEDLAALAVPPRVDSDPARPSS